MSEHTNNTYNIDINDPVSTAQHSYNHTDNPHSPASRHSDITDTHNNHHSTDKQHSNNPNQPHQKSGRSSRKNTRGDNWSDRRRGRLFIWSFISFKPEQFAWWNALFFLVGSICFLVEGIAFVCPQTPAGTIAYGCVGLAGACLFTVGSACQVLEVLQAPVEVKEHEDNNKNVDATQFSEVVGYSENPVDRYGKHVTDKKPRNGFTIFNDTSLPWSTRLNAVFGQFHRVDYTLSVIQLLGAVLFNINSVMQTSIFKAGVKPALNPPIFWGLTIGPDITGSCLFVIAGYLTIVEATHTILPTIKMSSIGCWAGYNNMLGGVGFLVNACAFIFKQSALLPNIPLLIGSAFFLFGSICLWLEQCM